jgi:hypothetical protein
MKNKRKVFKAKLAKKGVDTTTRFKKSVVSKKVNLRKTSKKSALLEGLLDNRRNDTFTENRMVTHSTTLSDCVDWFAIAGSARNWTPDQIVSYFVRALEENPLIAMKTLFWARDIREGAGERRLFRICSKFLDENSEYTNMLYKNIVLIPMYGRWDDIFHLNGKDVLELISIGLEKENGLLAKWLPRKGAFANKVRKYLGLSPKEYRKLLVTLSDTVEQRMCSRKWNNIVYEHVPSIAMNKYRKAFMRNDGDRYRQYISDVKNGSTSINASTLFPYHLYQAVQRREDKNSIEAQWENLPNFMEGNKELVLPMCDTSGSMTQLYGSNTNLRPMDVCVSLGIYISERNEGKFKDAFMTFSASPKIQYLKGSFVTRCSQLRNAEWGMNTNLEAAFRKILNVAVRGEVSENEMPTTILILSDMQFDSCVRNPKANTLRMIKEEYRNHGYKIPQIVFWQISARVGKVPVQIKDSGTAIVSGCSPTILKSVLDGSILSPETVMLKTVNSKRYEPVSI